jgi:ATP-binding protein involved in chromosome partitioning
MIDPRAAVIGKRLAGVRRVIAFCSAKGGVGKTTCTALAGLVMAGAGRRVGLLDLDLQGASAHLLLGVSPRLPEEDRGILPLRVADGLSLMGAAAFSGERGLALRGREVSDAILELLAVTLWADLDALLIDMPPGIGEEMLDIARLVPRMEALVISTPSALSVAVVERLLGVLREMRVGVAGLVANAVRASAEPVRLLAGRAGVAFGGEIPWDDELEPALGDTARLAGSAAARALGGALAALGLP